MLMWSRASWLLTCHADCGADLTSWSTSSALRSATPLQLGFAEDCAERLSQDACLLHPFAGLWPGCSISDKSPLPFRRLSSKALYASLAVLNGPLMIPLKPVHGCTHSAGMRCTAQLRAG